MFDDQKNNGSVPGNLPMEPVDMFAGTEKDEVPVDASAVPQTPNALSAGLLKKKDQPSVGSNLSDNMPPVTSTSMYEMKQPVLGKILLLVFLLAVLCGIGFGGWYFYGKFKNNSTTVVNKIGTQEQNNQPTVNRPLNVEKKTDTTELQNTVVTSTEVTASMNNDKILFGESVDSDKDGLDDVREKQLGTDINKTDTDNDGLNDSDEVIIWKTNPLKSDTDGDSYTDGSEVFHGYNPLGPGKLFNVPTTTNNAAVTSTADLKNTTTKK